MGHNMLKFFCCPHFNVLFLAAQYNALSAQSDSMRHSLHSGVSAMAQSMECRVYLGSALSRRCDHHHMSVLPPFPRWPAIYIKHPILLIQWPYLYAFMFITYITLTACAICKVARRHSPDPCTGCNADVPCQVTERSAPQPFPVIFEWHLPPRREIFKTARSGVWPVLVGCWLAG